MPYDIYSQAGADSALRNNSMSAPTFPSKNWWRLAGHPSIAISDGALTVNRIYALQLDIDAPCRLNAFGMKVTTAAAGSSLIFGLYDSDANGEPDSLVTNSTASGSSESTGAVTATPTGVNLTPGRYWVAVINLSAAVSVRRLGASSPPAVVNSLNSAIPDGSTFPAGGYRAGTGSSMPGTLGITEHESTVPAVAVQLGSPT